MSLSIENLQGHLDYLAAEMDCDLRQIGPGTPGMMYVEFGYVEGPTLVEGAHGSTPNLESKYMVNLHELGHFAEGHTQGRPPKNDETWYFDNGVLRSEAEAWDWALNASILPEYDKETRDFMWNTCMGSYYSHAKSVGFNTPGQRLFNGDRGYVRFAYGEPDDYFWGIKDALVSGKVRV
jgi:hypothetical protein